MTGRALCLAGALALGGGACGGHDHLTASHGRAYTEIFTRQVVEPGAGEKPRAVVGLDSQEAAIVAETFRRGLAPAGAALAEEPVIVLQPQQQPSGYLPPPSVPTSQRSR